MTRTANDDRSDTMNPNNDAYWADQANRLGDDDEGDDGSPPERPKPEAGLDTRFGPDPHPILGKRSNRLPGLSRDFRDEPRIESVAPWTERVAVAFATEETEKRDRALATDELMKIARWLLEEACAVIVRQGNACKVEVSDDGRSVAMKLGERGFVVHVSEEHDALMLRSISEKRERVSAFRFDNLRWYAAERDPYETSKVAYQTKRDCSVDPTKTILAWVIGFGTRNRY